MIKNFISISPSTSTQRFTCERLHPHIDPSLILVGGSFLMVSFSFPGEITSHVFVADRVTILSRRIFSSLSKLVSQKRWVIHQAELAHNQTTFVTQ